MDCVYINLQSRPDRRRHIENNFDRNRADGWTLSRFDAVDIGRIKGENVPGSATASEKGCFISHKTLIREHLSSDGALMVLEDDAAFGATTCQVIDRSLANIKEDDWDIIFTDICVPDVGTWPDLVRLRRRLEQTKALQLLSLTRFPFAGATSYILNRRSKRLLSGLMDQVERIDTPYDLYLRSLVHQDRLRAFVIFPFVTSVSEMADQSSIQASGQASLDLVLNWFRRSLWTERDLNLSAAHILPLHERYSSPETLLFAALFEAMLSDKIQRG
jgi:GR25 family glycosyltransferase involved in LPS biosynthesis